MIAREKIAATLEKYVAASKEYSNLLLLKKEMENLIIEGINSTYSDKEVEIAKKNRNYVIFQDDIDLEYKYGISWEYRRYFNKLYVLDLKSVDKPAIILSPDDIVSGGELQKKHEDLYKQLNELYKKQVENFETLCKEMKLIVAALSSKSMNITSIKKYYPELYKLMI